MLPQGYWSVELKQGEDWLRVYEPQRAEVQAFAPLLAAFYNDRHNAAMMTNTRQFTADDVAAWYDASRAKGDRLFLLEQDGELIGDADFRDIEGAEAEFAILIGRRSQQNRGLGTRFAALMHVAALRVFGLARVYATVIPDNLPSRRVLEKLGYRLDACPEARRFAETDEELVMSLDLTEFEQSHADLFRRVRIASRLPEAELSAGSDDFDA